MEHLAGPDAASRLVAGGFAVALVLALVAAGLRAVRQGVVRRVPVITRRGAVSLGGGASVHVLSIEGETIVVGTGTQGVSFLCRLRERIAPAAEGPAPPIA